MTDNHSDTKNNATIWGMTPVELHDRFWASRGVQVVRPGEPSEIVDGAELFLLTRPQLLMKFRLCTLVDQLSWIKPDVMWVRVHDERPRGYRERAVTDEEGNFIRFERLYEGRDSRLARVALTPRIHIARLWQSAPDARTGWHQLRRQVPSVRRSVASVNGRTYDRDMDDEVLQFVRDLIGAWKRPDATIERAHRIHGGVWGDPEARVDRRTNFIGPAWIGAGRRLKEDVTVVGPAVLWDDPNARPKTKAIRWDALEPTRGLDHPVRRRDTSTLERRAKRCFDIVVAILVLLLLLPIFPLIMAAIWIEDGRPFFFAHRRETRGGKTFLCLKFRSMRNNAEEIKAQLAKENQADGPQFYIKNDPRLTRIGRFLRKVHIDEVPQFFNVLAGDMSIVGPRPSPYEENQYSPAWREARLSVRPGITGLWQVMRTRQEGLDFQEWIKYDIEYVEKGSVFLDLWIIWKTVLLYFQGRGKVGG